MEKYRILWAAVASRTFTVKRLASLTGANRSTVQDIVTNMRKKGQVRELPPAAARGRGRPEKSYEVAGDSVPDLQRQIYQKIHGVISSELFEEKDRESYINEWLADQEAAAERFESTSTDEEQFVGPHLADELAKDACDLERMIEESDGDADDKQKALARVRVIQDRLRRISNAPEGAEEPALHFGTDGLRARVEAFNDSVSTRLAHALSDYCTEAGGPGTRPRIVIGRDTRPGSKRLQRAMESSFDGNLEVLRCESVLPTPGVSYLACDLNADLGIVVSASSMSGDYLGIKLVGPDGAKLSVSEEQKIQTLLDLSHRPRKRAVNLRDLSDSQERYVRHVLGLFSGCDLGGLRIALDCGYGASSGVAERILHGLGAKVHAIGIWSARYRSAKRINSTGCEDVRALVREIVAGNYDLGVALDADGDRTLLVADDGRIVDGDMILYILATEAARSHLLNSPVVGTVNSNIGLEQSLKRHGIRFLRAQVGDRNVYNLMKEVRAQYGGEPSGHIISMRHAPTGDGIVSALQVMEIMKRRSKGLPSLLKGLSLKPELDLDIHISFADQHRLSEVIAEARDYASRCASQGTEIIARRSGSDPSLVRLQVQGTRSESVQKCTSAFLGRFGDSGIDFDIRERSHQQPHSSGSAGKPRRRFASY